MPADVAAEGPQKDAGRQGQPRDEGQGHLLTGGGRGHETDHVNDEIEAGVAERPLMTKKIKNEIDETAVEIGIAHFHNLMK